MTIKEIKKTIKAFETLKEVADEQLAKRIKAKSYHDRGFLKGASFTYGYCATYLKNQL